MSKADSTLNSYVSFSVGDEIFAVKVSNVHEILEIPRVTKIPKTPAFMRGVINLRGNVLPVIDTREKFGLPVVTDTINSCILVINMVIDGRAFSIGAIVDSVSEVLEFDDKDIQPLPSVGSKYNAEFIKGMIKLNDRFMMLVDIEKIFSTDDVVLFEELSEGEEVVGPDNG